MYFSFYTILNFVKFGFWHFLANFWNLGLELNLYCPFKLIFVTFIVANILAFKEWKNIMYFSFYSILNFVKFGFWHFLAKILKFVLELNLYCLLKLICVTFIVANILAFNELKHIMYFSFYTFEFGEIWFLAFFGPNFQIWTWNWNWIYIAHSS